MVSQTDIFRRLARDNMGPAPPAVQLESDIAAAVTAIRAAKTSSVIVTDAAGRAVGIVTEQDICRRVALISDGRGPVESVMSRPLRAVGENDYLYHAIVSMRRHRLRHMPVLDAAGRAVGTLQLDDALTAAMPATIDRIERLSHEQTLDGLHETKRAQVEVAADLVSDAVPAPEIQALVSHVNRDLYRRVVELCCQEMATDGWGEPPVAFDVLIMGSGGRGESYLFPDQDNGFVLADYPDERHGVVDPWFIELATRMTRALDEIGFELCRGNVMATNPLWRKSLGQWRAQISGWINKSQGQVLRLADIFFDFYPVYGEGRLTADLRRHVTTVGGHPFFLREMYKIDEEHGVALGLFGRLIHDTHEGPHKGKVNLKLTGTLPLVNAARLMALKHGIAQTSTLARLDALGEAGVIGRDRLDYLAGAFRHMTGLLLRQQIADFQAGRPVGNHVDEKAMSKRERDMLVDGMRAIREFRQRIRSELLGEIF